jgi:hypothetical protein
MDKHTLTTIIITAVVSTVVKELVSWFVRRTAKVATTVKSTVIRYWRMIDIINEGVFSIFLFGLAFWLSWPGSPITGGVVFFIAFFVGFGFWNLRNFEDKLLAYKLDNKILANKRDPSA